MPTINGRTIFGIVVIFIGTAIYYCNSRITKLEDSIHKQQQVLSSFIANVQQTLHNENRIGGGNHNHSPHSLPSEHNPANISINDNEQNIEK